MDRKLLLIGGFIVAVVLLFVSCSKQAETKQITPTATQQTSLNTLIQAGQEADEGSYVFTESCAKCHGDNGQGGTGPAILGANARLSKYGTAQGLLGFMENSHQDTSGNLSHQQYLQVLAFMLVRDNYLAASDVFNPEQLQKVTLK